MGGAHRRVGRRTFPVRLAGVASTSQVAFSRPAGRERGLRDARARSGPGCRRRPARWWGRPARQDRAQERPGPREEQRHGVVPMRARVARLSHPGDLSPGVISTTMPPTTNAVPSTPTTMTSTNRHDLRRGERSRAARVRPETPKAASRAAWASSRSGAGEGIRSFEKPNGLATLHVILEASRPLNCTGSHCWEPVLDRADPIWRAESAERGGYQAGGRNLEVPVCRSQTPRREAGIVMQSPGVRRAEVGPEIWRVLGARSGSRRRETRRRRRASSAPASC